MSTAAFDAFKAPRMAPSLDTTPRPWRARAQAPSNAWTRHGVSLAQVTKLHAGVHEDEVTRTQLDGAARIIGQ